jgi:hypothetical protein
MAAVVDQPVSAGTPTRHTRRALSARLMRLQKRTFKALGYVILAYLLLRLLPAFKEALHGLEHVRWEWIVGAVALELLSEFGYVQSWRAIVDPDGLLAGDGRGTRTATREAWAQLGGGMLVRAGRLRSSALARGSCALRDAGQDDRRALVQPRLPQHRRRRPRFCSSASAWRSGFSAARAIRYSLGSWQEWPPPGSPVRWRSAGVEQRARGRLRRRTRSWPQRSAPSRGESTPPAGSCFTTAAGEACSARSLIWGSTRDGLAYLFLRREFGPMKTAHDVGPQLAER